MTSAQSGEKTALAIAILVSQTLYFTLVIEVTQHTPDTIEKSLSLFYSELQTLGII